MRTVPRALSACSFAAALSACAAPTPMTTVSPRPGPSFDGAYRGDLIIEAVGPGLDKTWCSRPGRFTIMVVNNRFRLNLVRQVSGPITFDFIVDVAPNGMFQSQASTSIFAGQIVGPRLLGLINGPGCRFSVTATRILTERRDGERG